jgi:Tol biopolymer transport system component
MKPRHFIVLGIVLICTLFSTNLTQGRKGENNSNKIYISNVQRLRDQSLLNNLTYSDIIDQLILFDFDVYLPIISNSQSNRLLAFLYLGDVWTVEENGTNLQHITNIGNVTGYSWSPDGERIALSISNSNGMSNIYLTNADGSNLVQITSGFNAYGGLIDWSGSKIAFLRDLGYPNAKISYIDMNGPTHPIIDISPIIKAWGMGLNWLYGFGLRWSPDGQWIFLYGGQAHGIASSDGRVFIDEWLGNPRWRNDSSLIITPFILPAYADPAIYFLDPSNNNIGYISQVNNHVAVYSPDDQYIIYCDDYALRRMKSDNTQHTVIAYVKATDPVWKPTGDKIAYVSWEEWPNQESVKLTGIHIINSDGSNPIQIISGWASNPRWQP